MITKSLPILAGIKKCTGCLACIDVCRQDALKKAINEEGHYTYKLDASKCVGCLQCEHVCPALDDKCYGDNSLNNTVYAAWSTNDLIRNNSSSGGVATEISKYILTNGGIIYGATMDGINCLHIEVSDINDLYKLQGSKYIQSDTTGIYRLMLKSLKEGKTVLFTGTPCQVAAAINYVKDDSLRNSLYTLDFACGGVPSLYLRDRFIKEYEDEIIEIHSFRNKDKGWKAHGYKYELKALSKQHSLKSYGLHNLLLGGFGMGLTYRHSCYNCKFALVNRKSDFTVADFWGDTDYKDQHYKGLSSLSAHTAKGKRLLNEIWTLKREPTTWDKVLPGNYRYAYGKSILGKTIARRKMDHAFKKYSYCKLCLIYAGAATTKNPIYFFMKAVQVFIASQNHKKAIRYINENILNQSR